MPFSDRGSGISFEPKTAFVHKSNEPILPLGSGIQLDKPLANNHEIDAAVRDTAVTNLGYQGTPAPAQWYGGPAITYGGSMVLRDSAGLVMDSLNFGSLVDPWAAEGYQGASGAGRSGCTVPSPIPPPGRNGFGRGRGAGAPSASTPAPGRSVGRVSDGLDTGSNCGDFRLQTPTPGVPNQ
jgi:hypothetical protein